MSQVLGGHVNAIGLLALLSLCTLGPALLMIGVWFPKRKD